MVNFKLGQILIIKDHKDIPELFRGLKVKLIFINQTRYVCDANYLIDNGGLNLIELDSKYLELSNCI